MYGGPDFRTTVSRIVYRARKSRGGCIVVCGINLSHEVLVQYNVIVKSRPSSGKECVRLVLGMQVHGRVIIRFCAL